MCAVLYIQRVSFRSTSEVSKISFPMLDAVRKNSDLFLYPCVGDFFFCFNVEEVLLLQISVKELNSSVLSVKVIYIIMCMYVCA